MAEWQTPKTDWNVESVPGPGDFKRIEGNEAYLKEQLQEQFGRLQEQFGRLGYAIRIADRAQTATDIFDSGYYFKWRSAFAVGKKVYFEANIYASVEQPVGARVYAQLFNMLTGTVITEVRTNTTIRSTILTSPAISIPDGALLSVRIGRSTIGTVYLGGAWLVIL